MERDADGESGLYSFLRWARPAFDQLCGECGEVCMVLESLARNNPFSVAMRSLMIDGASVRMLMDLPLFTSLSERPRSLSL